MSKVRPRPPRPWRPYHVLIGFILRSYYVVQSSYCVHPIFGGRSGNVAGVMGVLPAVRINSLEVHQGPPRPDQRSAYRENIPQLPRGDRLEAAGPDFHG